MKTNSCSVSGCIRRKCIKSIVVVASFAPPSKKIGTQFHCFYFCRFRIASGFWSTTTPVVRQSGASWSAVYAPQVIGDILAQRHSFKLMVLGSRKSTFIQTPKIVFKNVEYQETTRAWICSIFKWPCESYHRQHNQVFADNYGWNHWESICHRLPSKWMTH